MAEEDRGGTDRSKTKRTYMAASSRMKTTARVHTMSCTTSEFGLGVGVGGCGGRWGGGGGGWITHCVKCKINHSERKQV